MKLEQLYKNCPVFLIELIGGVPVEKEFRFVGVRIPLKGEKYFSSRGVVQTFHYDTRDQKMVRLVVKDAEY